jgi:hypothetical protein
MRSGPESGRVLAALARLAPARVSIEQPAMTDVFRRVLAEAGVAR